MILHILAFILVSYIALSFAYKRYKTIYAAIQLGRQDVIISDGLQRWKNMLLFALGQRKMFSKPVAGIFHLFIYLAFILTQIEAIEIFADGVLGKHRIFAGKIGFVYPFVINMIEILSVLALVATIIFLSRRNLLRLPRFTKAELKGWPFLDANIILIGEIILVISILMMNGAYQVLQNTNPEIYHQVGTFFISEKITLPIFQVMPHDWVVFGERLFWWSHYLVVLGFIVYLPYSKHLHIFLAFPNSYYADLKPRGEMTNIPSIENEVRGMIGIEPKENVNAIESFGAKDVNDLSWNFILQAFSCTECGRCTAVCPANITGKKLSPRKIVMDIRDRAEEIIKNGSYTKTEAQGITESTDGKSLFDYISKEEIYACTACNACVEACPVLINPLQPILELRRYDILMNSAGPQEWLALFNSLENNQAAWSMSEPRTKWMQN
jgi:heterodisulfide reductase subunit C